MNRFSRHAKRILVEGLGWLLVIVGVAALVLPGPGLLLIFGGMALLATQYDWAERKLEPVREAAIRTARESVETIPRIVLSIGFTLAIISLGIIWIMQPSIPEWWPFYEKWWLIGGPGTGITIVGSGVIAFSMIIFSFFKFRKKT